MYAGCRLGLRVTVSNTIESLLHSKAECGIWIGCTVGLEPENYPLRAPSYADELPVIRIGHGSTAYQYEAAPTRIGGVQ
jgi:hypothetical protein